MPRFQGMAHDLGRGAPQDYVLAYAWTNQAVARAQGQLRRDWVRIRHSIASKLSLKEMTDAQRFDFGVPDDFVRSVQEFRRA